MRIGRIFYFDAAHYLPNYDGKCERLHGHTYKLEVVVEGDVGVNGMIIDFNELKKIVNSTVLDVLDHNNLNDIFENPTAEYIADWIFSKLREKTSIYSIKLWEGENKWVKVCRS